MNNEFRNSSSEASTRGIVLIVALLLLVMLTILGIASMSGVVMQERMSSNVNLQTLAFEAASAGVPDALRFDDPDFWEEDACERGGEGEWLAGWEPADGLVELQLGNPADETGLPDGITIGYRQRVGCFEPSEIPPEWAAFDTVPMQLLVLTQGQVRRGNEVLAQREVEVRIGRRGTGDCLFTVGPIEPGGIGAPKSGVFKVEGEEGSCPIQFANPADAATFRQLLGEGDGGSDRTGNWLPRPPGIITGNLEMPWSDGLTLARAINAIKIGIRAHQLWGNGEAPGYVGDAYVGPHDDYSHPPAPNPFAKCVGTLRNQASTSVAPLGGLTYIAGDFDPTPSDPLIEGLVIIEGQFNTAGNTRYLADLLVLGGHLGGKGMGGEDSRGLIKVQNLSPRYWDVSGGGLNNARRSQVAYCTWGDDPPWENDAPGALPTCSDTAELIPSTLFQIDGGGNATITAEDCEDLRDRWILLNDCLDTMRELMDPDIPSPEAGKSWFEFHREFNPVLSGTTLDIPDFGDDPELVAFELPRCGEYADTTPTITSWREYIDRERWN